MPIDHDNHKATHELEENTNDSVTFEEWEQQQQQQNAKLEEEKEEEQEQEVEDYAAGDEGEEFANIRKHPFFNELLKRVERGMARYRKEISFTRRYSPEVINDCVRPLLQLTDYPFTANKLAELEHVINPVILRSSLHDLHACKRLHLYRSFDTDVIIDWSVEDFLRRRYESIHVSWEAADVICARLGWHSNTFTTRDCLLYFAEFAEFVELAELRIDCEDGKPMVIPITDPISFAEELFTSTDNNNNETSEKSAGKRLPLSRLLIRRKCTAEVEPSLTEHVRLMGSPAMEAPAKGKKQNSRKRQLRHKHSNQSNELHHEGNEVDDVSNSVAEYFAHVEQSANSVGGDDLTRLRHAMETVPPLYQANHTRGRKVQYLSLDKDHYTNALQDTNAHTVKEAVVQQSEHEDHQENSEVQEQEVYSYREYEKLLSAYSKAKVESSQLRRELLGTENASQRNVLLEKLSSKRKELSSLGDQLAHMRGLKHARQNITQTNVKRVEVPRKNEANQNKNEKGSKVTPTQTKNVNKEEEKKSEGDDETFADTGDDNALPFELPKGFAKYPIAPELEIENVTTKHFNNKDDEQEIEDGEVQQQQQHEEEYEMSVDDDDDDNNSNGPSATSQQEEDIDSDNRNNNNNHSQTKLATDTEHDASDEDADIELAIAEYKKEEEEKKTHALKQNSCFYAKQTNNNNNNNNMANHNYNKTRPSSSVQGNQTQMNATSTMNNNNSSNYDDNEEQEEDDSDTEPDAVCVEDENVDVAELLEHEKNFESMEEPHVVSKNRSSLSTRKTVKPTFVRNAARNVQSTTSSKAEEEQQEEQEQQEEEEEQYELAEHDGEENETQDKYAAQNEELMDEVDDQQHDGEDITADAEEEVDQEDVDEQEDNNKYLKENAEQIECEDNEQYNKETNVNNEPKSFTELEGSSEEEEQEKDNAINAHDERMLEIQHKRNECAAKVQEAHEELNSLMAQHKRQTKEMNERIEQANVKVHKAEEELERVIAEEEELQIAMTRKEQEQQEQQEEVQEQEEEEYSTITTEKNEDEEEPHYTAQERVRALANEQHRQRGLRQHTNTKKNNSSEYNYNENENYVQNNIEQDEITTSKESGNASSASLKERELERQLEEIRAQLNAVKANNNNNNNKENEIKRSSSSESSKQIDTVSTETQHHETNSQPGNNKLNKINTEQTNSSPSPSPTSVSVTNASYFMCSPEQYDGLHLAADRLRKEVTALEQQMEREGDEDDETLMAVLAASRADLEELDDCIASVQRHASWASERDDARLQVKEEDAQRMHPLAQRLQEQIDTHRFNISILEKRLHHTTQRSIINKLEQKIIFARREISRLRIEQDRLRRSGRDMLGVPPSISMAETLAEEVKDNEVQKVSKEVKREAEANRAMRKASQVQLDGSRQRINEEHKYANNHNHDYDEEYEQQEEEMEEKQHKNKTTSIENKRHTNHNETIELSREDNSQVNQEEVNEDDVTASESKNEYENESEKESHHMNEEASVKDDVNYMNDNNNNEEVVEKMNDNVMHKGTTRQAETNVMSNSELSESAAAAAALANLSVNDPLARQMQLRLDTMLRDIQNLQDTIVAQERSSDYDDDETEIVLVEMRKKLNALLRLRDDVQRKLCTSQSSEVAPVQVKINNTNNNNKNKTNEANMINKKPNITPVMSSSSSSVHRSEIVSPPSLTSVSAKSSEVHSNSAQVDRNASTTQVRLTPAARKIRAAAHFVTKRR